MDVNIDILTALVHNQSYLRNALASKLERKRDPLNRIEYRVAEHEICTYYRTHIMQRCQSREHCTHPERVSGTETPADRSRADILVEKRGLKGIESTGSSMVENACHISRQRIQARERREERKHGPISIYRL